MMCCVYIVCKTEALLALSNLISTPVPFNQGDCLYVTGRVARDVVLCRHHSLSEFPWAPAMCQVQCQVPGWQSCSWQSHASNQVLRRPVCRWVTLDQVMFGVPCDTALSAWSQPASLLARPFLVSPSPFVPQFCDAEVCVLFSLSLVCCLCWLCLEPAMESTFSQLSQHPWHFPLLSSEQPFKNVWFASVSFFPVSGKKEALLFSSTLWVSEATGSGLPATL